MTEFNPAQFIPAPGYLLVEKLEEKADNVQDLLSSYSQLMRYKLHAYNNANRAYDAKLSEMFGFVYVSRSDPAAIEIKAPFFLIHESQVLLFGKE